MQKISFLLIGTSLSFIPTITFAQCVATQDCATLGYTETSCNGGKGVKCPFGNKWACIGITAELCSELGFTYTCTGTGEIGVGKDCSGKYQGCTCANGYEWKDGACQPLNGARGELYYCNGTVVGVKATGMNFYVAMQDLGNMNHIDASQCYSYVFCGSLTGILPTKDQLKTIYNNKSSVNSLLSTNGGKKLTNNYCWSSTNSSRDTYYIVSMSDGSANISYPDNGNYCVRPVLYSW